jgi:hypothetical protein
VSRENALKVIDRLEGTLIADLKSLKIIAEERSQSTSLQEKLPGGFNFLLHIAALISCETLGYFIKKDSQEGRSEENIKYFVLSKYFKESAYKKNDHLNTLTSLRTNLAHVFGMTDLKLDRVTSDIALCVGGSKKPEIIRELGIIKFNGVKFAEMVIDGFEAIKAEVNKIENSTLIEILVKKK